MLWAIVVVLLICWLLGFTVFNLGSLIHILLIVVLFMVIYNLLTGRRGTPL